MRQLSVLVILCALVSCSKPLPKLEAVDTAVWKEDRLGCLGKREAMEPSLSKEMNKLKGLSEMDIVDLLGRPDANELYKRNQKFFFYYINPGPDCDDSAESPRRLVLRFNAMGYCQQVSINSSSPR